MAGKGYKAGQTAGRVCSGIALAVIVGLGVFFGNAASAQNPDPTLPQDDGPKETGGGFEVDCGPCHKVSIFDPHLPVTANNTNHRTIQDAIDHTRPGGTVIVHRDRNDPFLEPFVVDVPNITIRAADADRFGTVVIKQADRACVSIEPAGYRRFSDVVTTLEGVTFITNDGALEPCVLVRKGTLRLINSRVDMGTSQGTAIEISATGALEFSGVDYDEHGIFAGVAGVRNAGGRNGTGIVANGAKTLILRGIRVQGLEQAVFSRAEQNLLTGVRFFNNTVGLSVEDSAVVSAYSPTVSLSGGAFIENDDAMILSAGGFGTGPDAANSLRTFARPFRGQVLVSADITDPVLFEGNTRGLSFSNAYPTAGFRIDNAIFRRHTGHAIRLNLPARTRAEVMAVDFSGNARAITLEDSFDGQLLVGDGTSMVGLPGTLGIEIDKGRGRLEARLSSVFGVRPAVRLGDFFGGSVTISAVSGNPKQLVFYEGNAELCTLSPRDSKDRDYFVSELAAIRLRVNDMQISELLFDGQDRVSRKQVTQAQDYLCGRIIPQ